MSSRQILRHDERHDPVNPFLTLLLRRLPVIGGILFDRHVASYSARLPIRSVWQYFQDSSDEPWWELTRIVGTAEFVSVQTGMLLNYIQVRIA